MKKGRGRKHQRKSRRHSPGRYKFTPPVANQLWRANQHKSACLGPSSHYSLALPVTFGHTTVVLHAVVQPLAFSAATNLAMKRSIPCSTVLRHFPSSWATIVHWSVLMPQVLKSPRKHPIHSFSRPPTISANITHFGSLVSSMCATANKIHLLRTITSMLSLLVLISLSSR